VVPPSTCKAVPTFNITSVAPLTHPLTPLAALSCRWLAQRANVAVWAPRTVADPTPALLPLARGTPLLTTADVLALLALPGGNGDGEGEGAVAFVVATEAGPCDRYPCSVPAWAPFAPPSLWELDVAVQPSWREARLAILAEVMRLVWAEHTKACSPSKTFP
jgi:hypothetical protein